MSDPEGETRTYDPYTIPTPFGFRINPAGLFNSRPNDVFIPNKNGGESQAQPSQSDSTQSDTHNELDRVFGRDAGSSEGSVPGLIDSLIEAGYHPLPGNPSVYFNPFTGDSIDISTGRPPSAASAGSGGSGFVNTIDIQVGADGTAYRVDRFGNILGEVPELSGKLPPQTAVNSATGQVFGFNVETGQFDEIPELRGFAGIDPERDFALSEADVTGSYNGSPTIRATEETGRNSRSGLEAGVRGFESVNTLAPKLGDLAMQQGEFTRDVTRNAPDYLARAYFQQGQTSPLPQISQADLINNLRNNFQQYNELLQGFQSPQLTPVPTIESGSPGGFVNQAPAPVAIQPGSPEYQAAVAGVGGTAPWQSANPYVAPAPVAPAPVVRSAPAPRPRQFDYAPDPNGGSGVVALEGGGMASNMAVVGEKGPELVVDMPQGFMVMNEDQLGMNPKKMIGKVPGAQAGGIFGFTTPQLPVGPPTTQAELNALEKSVRPPAIDTILSGGVAQSPRFGFSLFTPQQTASLTPETRQALGTTLGTQYNETLENVEYAQNRIFGNPNQRRTATVAGFNR